MFDPLNRRQNFYMEKQKTQQEAIYSFKKDLFKIKVDKSGKVVFENILTLLNRHYNDIL